MSSMSTTARHSVIDGSGIIPFAVARASGAILGGFNTIDDACAYLDTCLTDGLDARIITNKSALCTRVGLYAWGERLTATCPQCPQPIPLTTFDAVPNSDNRRLVFTCPQGHTNDGNPSTPTTNTQPP